MTFWKYVHNSVRDIHNFNISISISIEIDIDIFRSFGRREARPDLTDEEYVRETNRPNMLWGGEGVGGVCLGDPPLRRGRAGYATGCGGC